MAKVNLGITA